MRIWSSLFILFLIATAAYAEAPPELTRVTLMTPAADSAPGTSAQVLEWSNGTKNVAAAHRALPGQPWDIQWHMDAATMTFAATAAPAGDPPPPHKPSRFAVTSNTVGTGYEIIDYLDLYDQNHYFAATTTLHAGWTQCITATPGTYTVTPEPALFWTDCAVHNPPYATLSYWYTYLCRNTPPTQTTYTVSAGTATPPAGSAESWYRKHVVGPTDVGYVAYSDYIDVYTDDVRISANGAVYGVLVFGYQYDMSWNDHGAITTRPPGLTCPDVTPSVPPRPGTGGPCLIEPCDVGMQAVRASVPVYDAAGLQVGTCQGSTNEVIACAAGFGR